MRFLLDTDTCVYAIKEQGGVVDAILTHGLDEIVVSVVTEAELRTGAAKSAWPTKNLLRIENFLRPFVILDFTSQDTIVYAQTRAKLERAGTPIDALDLIIAAQALTRDLTLVTNNVREFRRVRGLRITNWLR